MTVTGHGHLIPSRWAVVWWVDGVRHERYCDDRALAEAYAASHHGQVVPLAALAPWPVKTVGDFLPT